MIEYEEVIQESERNVIKASKEFGKNVNETNDEFSEVAEERIPGEIYSSPCGMILQTQQTNYGDIIRQEPDMWDYLHKSKTEVIKVLPPQLEQAYSDYVKYLKDNQVRGLSLRISNFF